MGSCTRVQGPSDQDRACTRLDLRQPFVSLREHWLGLEEQIARYTHDVELLAKSNDDARRLVTVPGVGPLGATALIAAVGDSAMLSKGCELAAWLGLVRTHVLTIGKGLSSQAFICICQSQSSRPSQ